MKKSTLAILIAVVALLLIGGVIFATKGSDDSDDTTTTTTTTTTTNEGTATVPADDTTEEGDTSDDGQTEASEVEIEDFAFQPANITVKKGTIVTWTNKDTVGHTVTPDTETAEFQGSSMLDKDESYSVTFDTVGEFEYFCQPHPQMRGKVTVTE